MATNRKPNAKAGRAAKAAGPAKRKQAAKPAKAAKKASVRKPAKSDNGRKFVQKVERAVREISSLFTEKLREPFEINGRRYEAFVAQRRAVKRELRRTSADRIPLRFVGGGTVDWYSRFKFRIKFAEPPLFGSSDTLFDGEWNTTRRRYERSVEVGGFDGDKTLDYLIFFGDSITPEDPSIIIDQGPVLLKPVRRT
jgi:hypothetical protein